MEIKLKSKDPKVRLHIYVPHETYIKLLTLAKSHGISRGDVVAQVINQVTESAS